MFSSNNTTYDQPMVVSYYDESLDQDVLRVVKMIRRRAGISLPPEANFIKTAFATPRARNDRSGKREQHIQSLPKYNIEVQTDSPFHKEKPSVPSVSITRKFPRKGFRDEFDYVEYEYNDENQLPPRKPTMSTRPKFHEPIASNPIVVGVTKRPPMVDTFVAALVKDPDSPSRHIQLIEERTMATFSDTSSTASSPSVFHDIISPINTQPYSFVCSTGIGKNFVTPSKANVPTNTSPKLFASFTEATDNETVDLSMYDDFEAAHPLSFWDGIVARILGTIAPMDDENDDDVDDTVLLTARAKYEDFFEGVASPLSMMPSEQHSKATKGLDGQIVTPITRRQLPPKIRTTLLHDFLDHMLGPDKNEYGATDDTIAGGSFMEDMQQTNQGNIKTTVPRLLWKSNDRTPSKNVEGLNSHPVKSTSAPSKPMDKSHRSRSALHDIVDQIVARFSSSASDIGPHQGPRTYLSSSSSSSSSSETDDDDDYESDDDDHDSVTNFITEISIPTTGSASSSLNSSADTHISDSDSISATVLSLGRHRKTKGPWKKANMKTMALLDALEDDENRVDDSIHSDDSSNFSFGATSFTFN